MQLWNVPSIHRLGRVLIRKGFCILSNAFFASIERVIWFFTFLVDMIYHTARFANVEPTLHPRDESHLVMVDNPFNVLLDPIIQDLVENLGVHLHQGYRSVILLFDGVFAWFGIKVILAS